MKPYYSDSNGQIVIFNAPWEEVWAFLQRESGLRYEDVALLWADPVYGHSLNTKRSTGTGRGSGKKDGRDWAPLYGDGSPFDPSPLLAFPRSALWGANHYSSRLPDSPSWWVWDKREDVIPERDQADGELAWTNLGGPARIFRYFWDGMSQKRKDTPNGIRLHPTMKPVALATWGFQRAKLKPDDLVFSSHMGSGPEARAALDMGLRFIGCEIVEEYCKAAVNRLRQRALFLEGV